MNSEKESRVLIAEDDPDQRDSLAILFERSGMDACTASDGVGAMVEYWRAVNEQRYFTLVILDMAMPRMDGKTVAARIRSAEAGAAWLLRAKIVGYTGYDRFVDTLLTDEDKALFDEILYKPTDPEKFTALAAEAGRAYV